MTRRSIRRASRSGCPSVALAAELLRYGERCVTRFEGACRRGGRPNTDAWEQLWADVAALLDRAGKAK